MRLRPVRVADMVRSSYTKWSVDDRAEGMVVGEMTQWFDRYLFIIAARTISSIASGSQES